MSATVQKSITTLTPVERPSQAPLTDLEVRLDTSRAIDLFTMRPKVSRLEHLRLYVPLAEHPTKTKTAMPSANRSSYARVQAGAEKSGRLRYFVYAELDPPGSHPSTRPDYHPKRSVSDVRAHGSSGEGLDGTRSAVEIS
jgi:hypothetical protein